MKFFDLEMDGCLGKLSKQRGGRNILYTDVHNDVCGIVIYHGGDDWLSCGKSRFTSAKECGKTSIEEIYN